MIAGYALGALGALILAIVLLDFLYTAIGAAPVAPLSERVARAAFFVFSKIMPEGNARHRLSGPVVMTAIAVTWIILVSLGWTLVFQISREAVVMTESERPAGFLRDFAFVGHLLSTLGGAASADEQGGVMPELGKYAAEVLSAYGVSLLLLAALVGLTLLRGRAARRALEEVEAEAGRRG